MATFRIAVLGGDGIGPEVIDQAVQVADVALRHETGTRFEWNRLPWNCAFYKKHSAMMPPAITQNHIAPRAMFVLPVIGSSQMCKAANQPPAPIATPATF